MQTDRLTPLFAPKSIAIVAAGRNPASVPGRPLRFLVKYGYRGDLYPISRTAPELEGVATLPSIDALPHGVDLAIVTLPTDAVLPTSEQLGRHGVRALVVFADGFSEAGPAGLAREKALLDLAERYGFVVLGPNTNGFKSWEGRVCATFATTLELRLTHGPVAIVTQSGALAGLIEGLLAERGGGADFVIDVGNEAQLTAADMVGQLAAAGDVSAIGLVLEGLKDGPALLRAVERATRAGKRVAVLQTARSRRGGELALSHSGALATDKRIFRDVMQGAGVVVVDDEVALADFLAVEPLTRRPARLGCVSLSGGVGILVADAADAAGLDMAPRLETEDGDWGNPHDLTARGMTEPGALERSIRLARRARDVGVLVVWLANTLRSPTIGPRLRDELLGALEQPGCDVVVTGFVEPELVERIGDFGHRCFTSPSAAAAALGRGFGTRGPGAFATGGSPARPTLALSGLPALTELQEHGLPVVRSEVFATPAGLLRALDNGASRFPVVIKSGSPSQVHKQSVGLVASDVRSLSEAERACAAIAAAGAPDGVLLLQSRVRSVAEAFLGYTRETPFGALVSLGLGGTLVEMLGAVAFCPVPVTRDAAVGAIRRTGLERVLRQQAGDGAQIERLVALAQAVGELAREDPTIAELDINPVMFDADREYAPAIVDAVIYRTPQTPDEVLP